ncbi:hypothetical protein [Streptomyces sp. NPDC005017]|uniref:hypothetical protein n=1 Tax=Streptomyces sp. NPDC005017 TaxID=3364706 RepID=UPI00369DA92A
MRGLPVRRIGTTALCAALVLGIAGPAAAGSGSGQERTRAASRAPVPGADSLLAQVENLGDIGTLTPVTDLVDTALKAENGRLTAEQATRLGEAARAAVAQAVAADPSRPTLPQTPAAPTVPMAPDTATAPAVPAEPGLPALTRGADRAPSADLPDDALAGLQKAVESLLAAVTSGNVAGVLPAATALVTGLVDLIASALPGGGLPAPSLPGLPQLPGPPVSPPELPPGAPELPASTPELPVAPAVPEAPSVPAEAPSVPVEVPSVPADAPPLPVDAPALPASGLPPLV